MDAARLNFGTLRITKPKILKVEIIYDVVDWLWGFSVFKNIL